MSHAICSNFSMISEEDRLPWLIFMWVLNQDKRLYNAARNNLYAGFLSMDNFIKTRIALLRSSKMLWWLLLESSRWEKARERGTLVSLPELRGLKPCWWYCVIPNVVQRKLSLFNVIWPFWSVSSFFYTWRSTNDKDTMNPTHLKTLRESSIWYFLEILGIIKFSPNYLIRAVCEPLIYPKPTLCSDILLTISLDPWWSQHQFTTRTSNVKPDCKFQFQMHIVNFELWFRIFANKENR